MEGLTWPARWQNAANSHKVYYEESLILLEYHTILDRLLLVEIIPGAVGALLAVTAVFQYPVAVLVFNCCLHLRDQLIVYSDVAVWWASDDQFLFTVLTNAIFLKRNKIRIHSGISHRLNLEKKSCTYTTSGLSRLYGGNIFSFSLYGMCPWFVLPCDSSWLFIK